MSVKRVFLYYKKSSGSGRVSVIRNCEVVRYSGAANVLIVYKNKVGTLHAVRYTETVRYWECPLIEVFLYIL